jgi:hypothetical protein
MAEARHTPAAPLPSKITFLAVALARDGPDPHLTGVGVSKLVRHDAGRDTGRSTDFVQLVAQLADQGGLAFGASHKMAVGRQGVERTEETETLNELTDKRVYRPGRTSS